MTRDWADDLERRYEQRLADNAQVEFEKYAAREQKRQQMREPIAPLKRVTPADVPLWWVVVALVVILGLLQLWPNDIGL